jgi:hypothetical protein
MKTIANLPSNEKAFSITLVGDTTKQNWTGEFTTVCMPNLRQKSEASIMEAQLNRDLATLDQDTILYHRMIAQLSQRLTEAPDWWLAADNGRNLLDANVIFEVFKACVKAEKEWREKVWGKDEKEEKKIKKSKEDVEEEE